MQAFHNNETIKQTYIERIKAHAAADEIVKGVYWENGKGCAIGCLFHTSDHAAMLREWDAPVWLARLVDRIFEGLPNDKAKLFPERLVIAIKVGSDLEKVKAPFLIFVLQSTLDKFDHVKYPDVKKSVDNVIALWQRDDIGSEDFKKAAAAAADDADAAAAAAADDADAAAAAAAYAAYAAAAAAANDADAAYAADAATAAARQNAFVKFSDKLIELIENV